MPYLLLSGVLAAHEPASWHCGPLVLSHTRVDRQHEPFYGMLLSVAYAGT